MKDIKFRAWNEVAKRYSKPFGIKSNVLNYTDDDGLGVVKSLTDEIIEQFTGFKDKNGKEIYEGDAVIFEDETIDFIVWDNEWQFHTKENLDNSQSNLNECEAEIIGNIHENPELLK